MISQSQSKLDPTRMENKKASLHNASALPTGANEMDAMPNHHHQQHQPPQYVRYVPQSLKLPITTSSHLGHNHQVQQQQQRQSPMIHQHMHPSYQLTHKQSYTSPNIHTNPLHIHYNNQYIYQQNKWKQQQQQVRSNQPPPPAYPSPGVSMSLVQSAPQPWTPQQNHHLIYQNQQQSMAVTTTTSSESSTPCTPMTTTATSSTTTTPVHSRARGGELGRKTASSTGTPTQLRSPAAKRPTNAPVTLQGWLHKQGSDGLMLWKKRWFVLCEYVLFYYKGSEEEKLLGSILLPSYKVSLCGPDDRVNRKYAFKCEHTNMRTYVLAADSHELMMQWVRVLNLACLLQSNTEPDTTPTTNHQSTSTYNENADYNATHHTPSHQQQQQQQQQHHHHQLQPLRLPLHAHSSSNTTDFSNPSQDTSQYNQPLYANAPPKPRRLNDTGYSSPSPEAMDIYNEPKYVTLQPPSYMLPMSKSNSVYSNNQEYKDFRDFSDFKEYTPEYHPVQSISVQNTERRTPDTYGRSKSHLVNGRHPLDYEDVYAEQYMYKRPLSPLAYDKSIALATPIQRTYNPLVVATRDVEMTPTVAAHKSPNSIPRPHSADFLEYDANHRQQQVRPQPARPKSSLDINRTSDNYFYSEERYAEKMRKSAQYLSKMPGKYVSPSTTTRHIEMDNTFPLMRSSTAQPLHYNAPMDYASMRGKENQAQPTRCRSVLSEGSISKELEVELCSTPQYIKDPLGGMHSDSMYRADLRDYDPFTRSASARLANIEQRLQGDGRASMNKEGERKREESMKRLLEWKQRMLQSPLNRKVNQNVKNASYGKHAKVDYYKMTNARQLEQRLAGLHYASYSSDDEENADAVTNANTAGNAMQAGRTLGAPPTDNPSAAPPYTSSSLLATQTTDLPSLPPPSPPPLPPSPLLAASDSTAVGTCTPNKERAHVEPGDCGQPHETGALVKSILADLATSDKDNVSISSRRTPTKDIEAIIEENYMTMTPKKNTFDFARDCPSTMPEEDCEENPYVEMTQGIKTSILDPGHQSYEMVHFTEQKHMEPLYMELPNIKKASAFEEIDEKKSTSELPDILLPMQLSKSDSSDADDEASKDLDSLYSTNPRFSLSDSFRPASYYLGAGQGALPEQDSSDSELVSPPPIPRSPPPMDDFEDNGKMDKNEDKISQRDPEGSSLCSTQTDEMTIGGLSQTSDLDVEFRKDLHDIYKRRPVSDDADYRGFDGHHFAKTTDINMYLKKFDDDLLLDNINRHYHDYENMIVTKFSMRPLSEKLPFDPDFPDDKCDKQLTSAPYYYSDLGVNTNALYGGGLLKLNNQRGTNNTTGKRDITHIVNPIRSNNLLHDQMTLVLDQYKLANEARSVSVDFLNLADKSGQIDKKNVYESDTLKRLKVSEQDAGFHSNPEMRNVYPSESNDNKFPTSLNAHCNDSIVRRTHSLEGLLENVLNDTNESTAEPQEANTEGSYLWEEDAIWRERLRNASQRHTKSLDDLDCIGSTPKVKKTTRAITRDVVYVNDNIYNATVQAKYVKHEPVAATNSGEVKKESGKENFTIDREKLRQWDLMSSAPSDGAPEVVAPRVANNEVEFGGGCMQTPAIVGQVQDAASGSMSMNMNLRDTFPRHDLNHRSYNHNQTNQSRSTSNLHKNSYESDYAWQEYYGGGYVHNQQQIDLENRKMSANDKVKLSAGDLLGRTHEELVLLLIQLRRQSTNICHAIEASYNEIESIQAQLHMMDATKRMESLQKLEQIKQHLLELEKQYEKGKPMVNLVDNMVKLGSLYRSPSTSSSSYLTRDRIEFNQQMQEKKLLEEERRDWSRINSNHVHLQEKVQQLYELDQMIQEGSGTLQDLQQDKEEIERALGGIRSRLMHGYNDPEIIEKAKKQQSILENELSRVHLMLAQNSKKLEETVAGNARLEQELLVLKQKLQVSKQNRSSPQFSNAGDSLPCAIGTSAMLEADLQKVQQKVGDLQKQRQEISMQVRQLTDRSSNISHVKPFSPVQQVADGKKKIPSLWRETDLDTMHIIDHGDQWESTSSIPSSSITSTSTSMPSTNAPLFIKTDLRLNLNTEDTTPYKNAVELTPEETFTPLHQEKQEIKTVRIVKRESERRHRDREKITPGKYEVLAEDDYYSSPSRNIINNNGKSLSNDINYNEDVLSRTNSKPSISQFEKEPSPVLSPVFKSEAARQIITEMAQETPRQSNRRAVPKEKRRHYTAPNNNLIMKSFNQLPTTDDETFNKAALETRRARDDLDMERALRQRIDAPDVVRSTLSSKELKYNENTIDNILGTPNKIFIPERYIPEQLPQLSAEEEEHRLRKVESIKKMLSDSTILSTSTANLANTEDDGENATSSSTSTKATSKMVEEKKQREHLLQLNQILAKQVMEMSKIVAVKALAKLPLDSHATNSDDSDDMSPISPLPLYQQRDNFYS